MQDAQKTFHLNQACPTRSLLASSPAQPTLWPPLPCAIMAAALPTKEPSLALGVHPSLLITEHQCVISRAQGLNQGTGRARCNADSGYGK